MANTAMKSLAVFKYTVKRLLHSVRYSVVETMLFQVLDSVGSGAARHTADYSSLLLTMASCVGIDSVSAAGDDILTER